MSMLGECRPPLLSPVAYRKSGKAGWTLWLAEIFKIFLDSLLYPLVLQFLMSHMGAITVSFLTRPLVRYLQYRVVKWWWCQRTGERRRGEWSEPHLKMTEVRQNPKPKSSVPVTNVRLMCLCPIDSRNWIRSCRNTMAHSFFLLFICISHNRTGFCGII